MVDLEWAHAVAALIGAAAGVGGSIFGFGWRMGRIEGRLEAKIKESEQRIEAKVDEATGAFDETLKGLRQKINDVELGGERRFLLKGDFNDFREEYRDDIRDLKQSIASIASGRQ